MKNFGIAMMLFMVTALSACGNSNSGGTISGNWSAVLTDQSGQQPYAFTATLAQNGSVLTVTNLSFTTAGDCFSSGTTASGAFTSTGTSGGVNTGTFQMTIQSGSGNVNGSNVLTLEGTLNNTSITGNWTETGTGAGCADSGTFTMTD
jgi:hypothetical protein